MPHYDLPLPTAAHPSLRRAGAADLDDYWQRALEVARARTADPVFAPYEEAAYGALAVDDVTFTGADGAPDQGVVPAAARHDREAPLPRHVHRLRRRPQPAARARPLRRLPATRCS